MKNIHVHTTTSMAKESTIKVNHADCLRILWGGRAKYRKATIPREMWKPANYCEKLSFRHWDILVGPKYYILSKFKTRATLSRKTKIVKSKYRDNAATQFSRETLFARYNYFANRRDNYFSFI